MSLLTTVKGVKRGGSNTLSLLWLILLAKAAVVAATSKIEPPIAHRLRVFEDLRDGASVCKLWYGVEENLR